MPPDDERPELPRILRGRYRPRWEDPPRDAPEGTPPTLVARDTVVDAELELARVPFGAERVAAREALVAALSARTTVLSPALVAVHDAGAWEDDAFVLTERVASPVPLARALEAEPAPTLTERLRWAVALADAAVVLDEAGLALSPADWAAVVVDAYHVPRVRGLERAVPATDGTRAETIPALGRVLLTLLPSASVDLVEREARRELGDVATRAEEREISLHEIRERLRPLVGAPDAERPLLPNVDPESLRRREAKLLVLGLAFFVLSFVVLIVVLARLR